MTYDPTDSGATGAPPLELWGGVECTINRVGDVFFDQIAQSGHEDRPEDLDRFAELGIRALRFPVLWERNPEGENLARAGEGLDHLRGLKIRPIVGLLHHGGGPVHTNLLDPGFPESFARYARRVAERFPWVTDYTPINEPLTTARFSALYGHWYPHQRGDRPFARAIANQIRAIALAMREIRRVQPGARLIQTEDLGKTHSVGRLADQARFENARRWLTFDLLYGRVAPRHRLWRYLRDSGLSARELAAFIEAPCPPDVLGINHYLTSERFLDDRLERYPPEVRGGNGRIAYADVEAVRVLQDGVAGPERLLREAWRRYRAPLAVTEAHLGCTREEQLRWLSEIWSGCERLRAAGVPVLAVTAWSLLGAHGWANLLTREDPSYEPGAFDVRSTPPRPTAVSALARELASGATPSHPVLATDGWWHREDRLLYPPVRCRAFRRPRNIESRGPASARPILVTGAAGTLGSAVARLCALRGLEHRALSRPDLDIADPNAVAEALELHQPWAIVNAAGFVRVDDAEGAPEACFRANTEGPEILARACARSGVRLAVFSSDLVFDGEKREPYLEEDARRPLGVYGRSKRAMEDRVLDADPSALVIRTGAFFGPWDTWNFVARAVGSVARGEKFLAASDLTVSPTWIPDLVNATLDLLIDGEKGVWHLANIGEITWAELARDAVRRAGLDPLEVDGRPAWALRMGAARPAYAALGSRRATLLGPLDTALDRFFAGIRVSGDPDRRVGSLAVSEANQAG